jgi:hypothetical protein
MYVVDMIVIILLLLLLFSIIKLLH